MVFYRRYVGDFLRDTARLSLLEQGVYAALLDNYFAGPRPLPPRRGDNCRLVRATSAAEKRAVDTVLATFFEERADGFYHPDADKEIERCLNLSRVNSIAGAKGAKAHWERASKSTLVEGDGDSECDDSRHDSRRGEVVGGTGCDGNGEKEANSDSINQTPHTRPQNSEDARARAELPPNARIRRRWWESEAGIAEAGLAVGVTARPGETWVAYKARVEAKVNPPPPK